MGSIYDLYHGECFEAKLAKLEPIIYYASKRFEIAGVLSQSDLYQEGLATLDEALEENWEYDPESEEFDRAFKSRLFYRMNNRLFYQKRDQRDHTKTISEWISNGIEEESIFDSIAQTTFDPPDSVYESKSIQIYIEALKEDLQITAEKGSVWKNVVDDALEVLKLLLETTEIPDEYKVLYERFPSRLTKPIIADLLNWDVSKVRRAIDKLREHAIRLCPKFGLEPPKQFRKIQLKEK